ncbi:MAG: S-methyl-5-thioribose-1-phosphate isomerase [Dehalococcoidia bacterium]|nr:S-methyl-5-thioribose-1-phosphate isomerase [Dehalococcoidia bacterium]MDW8119723.1 S-methyl-5-thioribose-1-phosphate isomerase [Chloroflexota bacterium]
MRAVAWRDDALWLLDQSALPVQVSWVVCRSPQEVEEAIRSLKVRGAPAIGIAGAYGVALAARHLPDTLPLEEYLERLHVQGERLARARPTAVNLRWAVERTLRVARAHRRVQEVREAVLAEAHRILQEDVEANRRIGALGADLLPHGCWVLTHCNTGALATGGWGTALGVIRTAWAQGKLRGVYATETRPLLQGARLTTWELHQEGIPVTLVVDGAVGALLRQGKVDAVVVGADRIAANGDVANKIGTYPLAVLAHRHGIPFYVCAPTSTLDWATPSGEAIVIEERSPLEVVRVGWGWGREGQGLPIAPAGVPAWNPAFDITPADLVTAIITEVGVARFPYAHTLPRRCGSGESADAR